MISEILRLHAPRLLLLALLVLAAPAFAERVSAQPAPPPEGWRHAITLMGEPKYPAGFAQFDYVNPAAPKGGVVRLGAQGSFDNLNLVVSGVKGDLESQIPLLYDSLSVESQDEPFTSYGLLADGVRLAGDLSSVTFRMRPEARFHDGHPVTPDDVVFSFDLLKANSPQYAFYYQSVSKAERTGEREVTFRFAEAGNRELPQIVGQMPVLPKHWFEGRDAAGRTRDPTATTLEPPLGSGPYRVKALEAGRNAVYERVPDYWARDLPVNRGRYNFGELRVEYFRDASVLIEAFKADQFDWRSENIARNWATAYDEAPAFRAGRIVKEEFAQAGSGIMQGFFFNLRRGRFADARVRRAFNLAFDFEDINRTLFYGLYARVNSYFYGTELAASGLPDAAERAILEGVRDKVPGSVFTAPYANPVNGSSENLRGNLREAVRLLAEAGYEVRGGRLVNKTSGEPFTVEFLGFDGSFERYVLPYRQQLERIGITASLRVVDPAQYQNRLRAFDFDVVTLARGQSLSPGNEQREYWGSAAADRPGSQNLSGIKDPGVDALIERVVTAKDRADLIAATHALDRVLLAHDYVVPQWSSRVARTLRWNRFGRPAALPAYASPAFPTVWWWDEALAAKTAAAR